MGAPDWIPERLAKPLRDSEERQPPPEPGASNEVSQRELPLTLAGAGLPQLSALTGAAKSYAERLFRFPTIYRLAEHAKEDRARPDGSRRIQESDITRFRRYVEGFAKRFDIKLRTQIRSITGTNP
jgi:hypothetical protein